MVADLATGPASKSSCFGHPDSEIGDWDSSNYGLALGIGGLFLGAMPPENFLDKFLPVSQDAPKCPNPRGDFTSVASAEKEDGMYAPFIAAVKPFAPNLMFIDTHAKPDTRRNKLAPHISVYPIKDQPQGDAKTDFSKMDLFVEFKFTDTSDPFCDPEDPMYPEAGDLRFEKDSKNARLFRGRLASYAAALAWCQFRVHSFCVLVCGKYARFIRWDRGGATVTQRFNYIEEPHFLAGFFWSYDHLDRRQQGYDTSMIQEDIQRTLHLKPLQDDNPDHREFRKLMVPDRDEPKVEKQFVVSFPPRYKACSPFGRATRPMLAFDVEKGEIVFLKDYWREDGVKEGEIYALLESKRVPNIPPFGKGNDVRDNETLTDKLRNEEWACGSKDMVTLRHYRMTLDVVAEPLTSFRSSKELVSVIADAMDAHQHAYFDAHVLHRDISAGNILITDKVKNGIGRGLLIDWDLCAKLDSDGDGSKTARLLDRTGTWQFMSARLLGEIGVPHELEDDRESCLHVLTWMALRYTKHTISGHRHLSDFLESFDEEYEGKNGIKGGSLKTLFLIARDIPKKITFDNRPQLDGLIKDLTLTFAVRYERAPSEEEIIEAKNMAKHLKATGYTGDINNFALNFERRMDDLKSRDWLVTTFRKFLELSPWPKADKSEVQVKLGKRKNTEALPTSSKSSRLHGGSGRHTGSRGTE